MATITQTKERPVISEPRFELDVPGWLRTHVFDSVWKIIFAILLIAANIVMIRGGFNAEPVGLSFNLSPEGQFAALGNLILFLTNGALLTSIIVILWVVGAAAVIYGAMRRHWPGPVAWVKDSLYGGPFGALTTLFLTIVVVFSIRGILSWAVFGAEFRSDPEQVAILRATTPGAIWGVILANTKFFAVGLYPTEAIWRVWASLIMVIVLSALSALAWGFGSPLKKYRKAITWGWLLSMPLTYWFLGGINGQSSGLLQEVSTSDWGGFLLTVIITVFGIVLSFPLGVALALGRRSQTRGVPALWLWGLILLTLYWLFFGFPSEPKTLNIPVIFRDPPLWTITLPPLAYAALQALIVVGSCWLVGFFLGGNLIKTFSILFIELIRGVPFITILFMANVMIPIFLPKDLEIDNLFRVMVGVIIFTAAYLAEDIRGGLQAIPKGQYEAAAAMGLSNFDSTRLIIMPQALRAVIPALVGGFIGLFKDTSLVAIVGLFDLLRVAQAVIAQPEWLGLQRESYFFACVVFWFFCFLMSRASLKVERNLGVGER